MCVCVCVCVVELVARSVKAGQLSQQDGCSSSRYFLRFATFSWVAACVVLWRSVRSFSVGWGDTSTPALAICTRQEPSERERARARAHREQSARGSARETEERQSQSTETATGTELGEGMRAKRTILRALVLVCLCVCVCVWQMCAVWCGQDGALQEYFRRTGNHVRHNISMTHVGHLHGGLAHLGVCKQLARLVLALPSPCRAAAGPKPACRQCVFIHPSRARVDP